MAKVWQRVGIASALVLAAYLGGPDTAGAQAVQQRGAPAIALPGSGAVSSYSSPAIAPAGAPVAGQNWPGMVRAAGVYALYRDDVRRAAAVQPVSAEDLERLLTRLAGYDGARLSLAFRAHAVMLAMQSPAFAAGVQQWGHAYDRRAIIANLRSNSAYANRIPGYQQAVTRILEAARDDAATIHLAGGIYKDLAYSLQHKRWALKVRRGKSLLLAAVHNAANDPPPPPPAMLRMVQQDYARSLRLQSPPASQMASAGASGGAKLSPLLRSIGPGPAQAARAEPMAGGPALKINPAHVGDVQDMVASAAVHMLDHSAPFPDRLSQRRGADSFAECVDWARMHLNQCVAATHAVYETSFCIAEHQLKDTASCLAGFAVSR